MENQETSKPESSRLMEDFMVLAKQKEELWESLTKIRGYVSSVNLFSDNETQHKQMDSALRQVSEELESIGIC